MGLVISHATQKREREREKQDPMLYGLLFFIIEKKMCAIFKGKKTSYKEHCSHMSLFERKTTKSDQI
jgi:hypothetical protein